MQGPPRSLRWGLEVTFWLGTGGVILASATRLGNKQCRHENYKLLIYLFMTMWAPRTLTDIAI